MKDLQLLNWYENWLRAHSCDDFDKYYRIEIKTIDNPGWCVIIDLDGTELSGSCFDEIKVALDDENWINCFVKDNCFFGFGGPMKLKDILCAFKEWATREERDKVPDRAKNEKLTK